MTPQQELEAALARCADEPIHIPGAVQPFGALVALDRELDRVLQVSSNIQDWLALKPEQCLGSATEQVLGKRLLGQLRNQLRDRDQLPGALVVTRRIDGHDRRFYVIAYRSDDRVVVEMEHYRRTSAQRLLPRVNQKLERIVRCSGRDELLATLVTDVRTLTGFDRVMVYAFDRDWHGTVIAEDRAESLPSFLNHRFPASDIPPQARAMYDHNRVRSIPDVTAAPVALLSGGDPASTRDLDLSRGYLRAVSPVHLQYLHNMGVGAALSIAIHDDNGLWGLVACHNLTASDLSPINRDAASTLVQVASQRLFLLESEEQTRFYQRLGNARTLLARDLENHGPEKMLATQGREWCHLLAAGGVGLAYRDTLCASGEAPTPATLLALAEWLDRGSANSLPFTTMSLQDEPGVPVVDQSLHCGLLAIPLTIDIRKRGWLLFFRSEQIETRRWAGKPEHETVTVNGNLQLNPRRSFAEWQETVRGKSAHWSQDDINAARALGQDLALLTSAHEVARLNTRLNQQKEALAEANRNLEKLARTDSLTGLWNRGQIEREIVNAINASERYGHDTSLLLLDLDYFKAVNDRHGHNAGDEVLKEVARVLSGTLRATDMPGRWGGEEFVVLAPSTGRREAVELAERLRSAIAGIRLPGEIEPVTASVGIASWRPGDNSDRLVARADHAMYRAKEGGRNRVELEAPA